jgi:hypothetical protein
MKQETLEILIYRLDAIIATLEQAVVIGGRSKKEREATELLTLARLKLVEELEAGEGNHDNLR